MKTDKQKLTGKDLGKMLATARKEARERGVRFGNWTGKKRPATIEKEKAKKEAQLIVARHANNLIRSGMTLAIGNTFIYRIDPETKKSVLVVEEKEIAEAIDYMMEAQDTFAYIDGKYLFATTKEPDQKSIQMLLEFAFGKPKESLGIDVEHKFSLKDLGRSAEELRQQRIKEASFTQVETGSIPPPA